MPDVEFKVRFMDWRKGDKATLNKRFAEKYIGMGVCEKVKPPGRPKKRTTAPSNKRAVASSNK